jgi:hypothetical protein
VLFGSEYQQNIGNKFAGMVTDLSQHDTTNVYVTSQLKTIDEKIIR